MHEHFYLTVEKTKAHQFERFNQTQDAESGRLFNNPLTLTALLFAITDDVLVDVYHDSIIFQFQCNLIFRSSSNYLK